MNSKLIYPKLSYRVNGVLFKVHNELGRYHKEKQYQNIFEEKLKIAGIKYEREKEFPISPEIIGNRVDFCIENKLLVELKAK